MPFQFLCPKGHLLQAEVTAAGSRCRCPHCQILFLIPLPRKEEPAPDIFRLAPEPDEPAGGELQRQLGFTVPEESDDEMAVEQSAGDGDAVVTEPQSPDDLLAVVCPKGHRLQAFRKMLDTDVLCTVCHRHFRLTAQHTLEYLTALAQQQTLRERQLARMWFNGAITAAVLVLLSLVLAVIWLVYR